VLHFYKSVPLDETNSSSISEKLFWNLSYRQHHWKQSQNYVGRRKATQ
jgi:hypothetical protein